MYGEDERFPCHYEIDDEQECFGELEEYSEKIDGFPRRVFYRCTECGQEFDASYVLHTIDNNNKWGF